MKKKKQEHIETFSHSCCIHINTCELRNYLESIGYERFPLYDETDDAIFTKQDGTYFTFSSEVKESAWMITNMILCGDVEEFKKLTHMKVEFSN